MPREEKATCFTYPRRNLCWFPLRSFSNSRPRSGIPKGLIWITNVLRFPTCSQVLVSWGILGPIKPGWQWLSPPGPLQGSTPHTDPTSIAAQPLASTVRLQNSNLVQESTQTRKTQGLISSLTPALYHLLFSSWTALFWLNLGLTADNPLLPCGQIILTPI